MSNLSAFLHPVVPEEQEIVISKRFLDENGNPVAFKIRPLTQEENEAITKQATVKRKINGQMQDYVDPSLFTAKMVVAATVEPDFSSSELCQQYGVLDPTLVPKKMLLSGEYSTLLNAITELSGFNSDVEEEAKN